jgi:hypothetical protein
MKNENARRNKVILPYSKYLEHKKASQETCGHLTLHIQNKVKGASENAISNSGLFDSLYKEINRKPCLFDVPRCDQILSDDTLCPYCKNRLYKSEFLSWTTSGEHLATYTCKALSCEICNWWVFQVYHRTSVGQYDYSYLITYEGIVYQFDVCNFDLPLTAIRKEISKKGFNKTYLSPKELELLVGSIMRDYLECKVKHLGGPGDGGIDLLLLESEHPVIVQVKHRKNRSKKESVSVVRELLGTLLLKGYNRGIIATTATDFSKAAKEAAAKIAQHKCAFTIDLYNQEKIRDILLLTEPPEKPWSELIPQRQ